MNKRSYDIEARDDCALVAADPRTVERVESTLPVEQTAENMVRIFDALSDRTRLTILMALRAEELCVHALAQVTGISQSGVSHQLRFLRDSGLVSFSREGKHVIYRLSDDHVAILIDVAVEHAAESNEDV